MSEIAGDVYAHRPMTRGRRGPLGRRGPARDISDSRVDSDALTPAVYRSAAMHMLPRCLSITGSALWLDEFVHCRASGRIGGAGVYAKLSAALALGLLRKMDPDRADDEFLADVVRSTLIGWQLSLRGDGKPVSRQTDSDRWCGASLGRVVELVTETDVSRTDPLLADVERHAEWLSRRKALPLPAEAETIAALSDCALLTRRVDLRQVARKRLSRLLALQDEEGWFRDKAGANDTCLSLILNPLARLLDQHAFGELEEPLRRLLRFLRVLHLSGEAPAGHRVGGQKAGLLISSYGAELLSTQFEDAAALALACRASWRDFVPRHWALLPDECFAFAASRVALAALYAPYQPAGMNDPGEAGPNASPPAFSFARLPNAGINVVTTAAYYAIVHGRRGGALAVTWRNGESLFDGGVIAVDGDGVRTSGTFDGKTSCAADGTVVRSTGALRSLKGRQRWWGLWAVRLAHCTFSRVLSALRDRVLHVAGKGRRATRQQGNEATRQRSERQQATGTRQEEESNKATRQRGGVEAPLTLCVKGRLRHGGTLDASRKGQAPARGAGSRQEGDKAGKQEGKGARWQDDNRYGRANGGDVFQGEGMRAERPGRDRFEREITFGADWFRVVDRIACCPPSEFVLLECAPFGAGNGWDGFSSSLGTEIGEQGMGTSGRVGTGQAARPMVVEGGRYLEISRFYRDGVLEHDPLGTTEDGHLSSARQDRGNSYSCTEPSN